MLFRSRPLRLSRPLQWGVVAVALLGVLQIALGGWVSTNYAALACGGFPLCQGALLPAMDIEHGFTLWRHLGMTAGGDCLPFEALVAIHWAHRMFALVAVGIVAWISHKALRIPGLESSARALAWVMVLQVCVGVATVSLDWPLTLAVLHNAGAALLLLLLAMLNFRLAIPAASPAVDARPGLSPA